MLYRTLSNQVSAASQKIAVHVAAAAAEAAVKAAATQSSETPPVGSPPDLGSSARIDSSRSEAVAGQPRGAAAASYSSSQWLVESHGAAAAPLVSCYCRECSRNRWYGVKGDEYPLSREKSSEITQQ